MQCAAAVTRAAVWRTALLRCDLALLFPGSKPSKAYALLGQARDTTMFDDVGWQRADAWCCSVIRSWLQFALTVLVYGIYCFGVAIWVRGTDTGTTNHFSERRICEALWVLRGGSEYKLGSASRE